MTITYFSCWAATWSLSLEVWILRIAKVWFDFPPNRKVKNVRDETPSRTCLAMISFQFLKKLYSETKNNNFTLQRECCKQYFRSGFFFIFVVCFSDPTCPPRSSIGLFQCAANLLSKFPPFKRVTCRRYKHIYPPPSYPKYMKVRPGTWSTPIKRWVEYILK